MRAALPLVATFVLLGAGLAAAWSEAAPPSAPATAPVVAPAAPASPRPLLWKVSDGNNSLYLLGSFHALKPGDYPLAPAVDAAFADAEAVAFEVAPEELESPELAMSMLRAGSYADGHTLQQSVDARTWQRLEAYAKRRNKDPQFYQRFEPWFASLLVSLEEFQRLGYDPKQGLDRHMAGLAASAHKRTLGLETAQSQVDLFDQMTIAEQRQSLAEALDDAEDLQRHIEELHSLWRSGDEPGLQQLLTGDFHREYPALYQRIDVDRNKAWVGELSTMLDGASTDDTLVVVGAMHLLGPDGLVSLLKARGYRVERL
jgi:uncharacterized protein YbaP (TraB family)